MDENKTINDEEIEDLCNEICNNIQDSSSSEKLLPLQSLRTLCGLRKCVCLMLTPPQNLRHLLKVQCHSESVLSLAVGLAIIKNYDSLGLDQHCHQVLERVLIYTMSKGPSEENNKFIRELWEYPGLKDFSITAIEDLIAQHGNLIEEDILNLFEESVKTNKQLTKCPDYKYERIILWCSNSTRIFCTATSIFNALLQRTASTLSVYNTSINAVNQFICNVQLKCITSEKDFVLLYPLEYHSLVSILSINPDNFPESPVSKSSVSILNVVELIKSNLERKPLQTLCVLTHFPAWIPFINR